MRAVLTVFMIGGLWGWVSVLAMLTHHRVRTVWVSNVALWADVARVSPERPRVIVNYGSALEHTGDANSAVLAYLATLRACQEAPRRRDAHCPAYVTLALANILVSPSALARDTHVVEEALRLAGCQDAQAGQGTLWTCPGHTAY